MISKKSIIESLVTEGMLTAEQLEKAREEEKRTGQNIVEMIIKSGLVSEDDLVTFLSEKSGIPRVDLSNYLIDTKILTLLPEEIAKKFEMIPISKVGSRITCAMADPFNLLAQDEVRARTGLTVDPLIALPSQIKQSLHEHYGAKTSVSELIKSMDKDRFSIREEKDVDVKKLKGMVEEPAVIRLVNLLIIRAVQEGASDIHIEPEEHTLKIRFRVDGILHEEEAPPKHLQSAIISRVKIMSNLDIAERRSAQDGRFTVNAEGRQIDVRVSCVPTIYGENVVLRLLDVAVAVIGLEKIGFAPKMLKEYESLIKRPYGIILVTGPTGSGKTTTLYSSLDKINNVEQNIITIEDPVEYKLPGIRQIHVNPKAGLTFAGGLRSILRQDPDVIMVGEIRDLETAEIAIQAALTGHLVFSTLHTNDASSAVTRLTDMGVEPFLVSSSVIGIIAQRLVRKICPDCKEKYSPSSEMMKSAGINPDHAKEFFKGKGCVKCRKTGYRGRIGIFELMVMNDKIKELVVTKAPAETIRKAAVASGMMTLLEDGLDKVRQGITTIEEVLRVSREA